MKRYSGFPLILGLCSLLSLSGCFKDLGNYDYTEINDIVIGDKGFDKTYEIRTNETLQITPEITFTLDPDGTGDYSYEWVAVSQNFNRGERFTIGNERNLSYAMQLESDEYILYLKVKDNSTGIVFSKSTGLNVRSLYSLGWILGGTGADGQGQADMMSISSDTLFLHNVLTMSDGLTLPPVSLVWIDNDEWTTEDRLYVASAAGSYKFDRADFKGSPYSNLKYSFAFPPEGTCILSDSEKITDKRHVIIADGLAYVVSSDAGMIGNTFSYYEDSPTMSVFKTAPEMICNHRQKDVRTFVFYNDDEREFCYISGLTVKGMRRLGDGEGDTYSWKTRNDFTQGLEFVTAVNSFFGDGQSAAIMKDPATGKHYIYCITASNGGVNKDGRYEVTISEDTFASAVSYIVTTNHGYMLYASGNNLYGYDFRKAEQTCEVVATFDAPVTMLYADNASDEKYDDFFYLATYDDAKPSSGILYKYKVTDSPDKIEVNEVSKWDKGFLKIDNMCYKAF